MKYGPRKVNGGPREKRSHSCFGKKFTRCPGGTGCVDSPTLPRQDRRCGPKYGGATCDPEGKSPSLLNAEQNRKVNDRRIHGLGIFVCSVATVVHWICRNAR